MMKTLCGFGCGTRIATQDGQLPVEWVCEGDAVITRDLGLQRVSSVHHTIVPGANSFAQPDAWPITLDAPLGNLVVAPWQTVLQQDATAQLYFGSSEILVRAADLSTASWPTADWGPKQITLIILTLEKPALVLANGLWCGVEANTGAARQVLTTKEAWLIAASTPTDPPRPRAA